MGRSLKKGPFVEQHLLGRILAERAVARGRLAAVDRVLQPLDRAAVVVETAHAGGDTQVGLLDPPRGSV